MLADGRTRGARQPGPLSQRNQSLTAESGARPGHLQKTGCLPAGYAIFDYDCNHLSIASDFMRFYTICAIAFMLLNISHPASTAGSEKIRLDGLWFTCEYAHSQIPPSDNCAILDDDGFLVEGDFVWHMKVQDGDAEGCRGNRAGNCFQRERKVLTAKKKKIGQAVRTEKGAIIEYMWCGQPYEITHGAYFSQVKPVEPMCPWTSKKTYYVSQWNGQMNVVE